MTPKKAFFAMIAVVGLTIVLGFAMFYYGDQRLQERSAEISDLQADREALQRKISIFTDSKQKTEQYSFVSELTEKVVPDDKYQSEVLVELRTFASDSGLNIESLTFGGGDAGIVDPRFTQTVSLPGLDDIRVLQAGVNFRPTPSVPFNNFINFLEKIENNQRKMQVTNLSISPDNVDPSNISGATFSINIFLRLN